MNRSMRRVLGGGVAVLTLSGSGLAVQAVVPGGSARADTCTEVGNRASYSVCADLTDVVGEILTPGRPDRELGNLTPNVYSCLGWDGRWVNADSCT